MTRGIAGIFVFWLVTLGPGNFLLPYHYGFCSVDEGGIKIYFQQGVKAETLNAMRNHSRSARTAAIDFWGQPPGEEKPISIFLFQSQNRYKQFTLGAGGNASCADSNLFLNPTGIGDRNLEPIIRHEMSHAIARQHTGYLGGFAMPVWMEEGVATYLGTPDWASPQSLRHHVRKMPQPRLVSATDMNSTLEWSSTPGQLGSVEVQYAYARSLVEDVIRRHGQEKVRSFLLTSSLLDDANGRFRSTFGRDLREVENAWLAEQTSHGHLPKDTAIVAGTFNPGAAATHWGKYIFLLACGLCGIRQSCRLLRFLVTWKRPASPQPPNSSI